MSRKSTRKSTKSRRRKSGRAIARTISGAASLVTVVVAIGWGMLPAIASKLTSWNYDQQTRSLTLTLPANVTPTVSVIAPNQMLVELPDTQIGDIAGQNVDDGLVESITLKQTTSDKVWMVVNFVPGTALAAQQNVVPLGGATPESSTPSSPLAAGAGLQQWQVRPALVAGRPDNSSVNASVESVSAEGDAATATAPSALSPEAASLQDGSAANLSDRGNAIAQTPMFPELPILEPAMPINAPVSVPPINVRPVPAQPTQSVPAQAAAPPDQAAPPVQASVPPDAPPKPTESASAEQPTALPIQAAPPVQASVSPMATSKPPESASAEQPIANSSGSQVPLEPPFIGDLEGEVNNPAAIDGPVDGSVDEPALSEPAVAASPPTSAPPTSIDRPSIDTPSADRPPTDTPPAISETASEPTNSAESEAIAANGSNRRLANAGSPEAAIPEINIPVENAHTPSTNRWPEPIPFGQPLP